MRILIVDDDHLSAGLIAECLMLYTDVSVEVAGDGASALDLVARTLPDVILLDVELPDMSGLLLAQQIRATGTVPGPRIVILSGNAPDESLDYYSPPAVDAWLVKPVGIAVLHDHIWGASTER